MEDDLKNLYDAVSGSLDIGDYDSFASKMKTTGERKSFYDAISDQGLDLGGYDEYEGRLKKKDESSVASSAASSTTASPSQSPEDRFPFLKGDDQPPVAEPSSTRVESPPMEKDIVYQSETAQKYGLPPSETEFELPEDPTAPAQSMIQKWAGKKYDEDPAYKQAVDDITNNTPIFEEAGASVREGLTTPNTHPFVDLADRTEFGRTALGFLKGVNEGVAGTLRAIDGAERAFYDAVSLGQIEEGGWFGKAADFMEQSLKENWPEAATNTVTGKLVYDLGHMVPFFGELMVTPKIGKIGQLENLLTTKGFASAYGDADMQKDLGYDTSPLVAGLYGGAMGLKDALTFHLLGYVSGELGKVVSKAARSGDAGVAANMLANGTGFAAYDALDQYITTGEVDPSTLLGSGALGIALASPGGMKIVADRAINNYYGASRVSVEKVRQLKQSVVELREIAFSLRNKAEKTDGVSEKVKILLQAKSFDQAADIKATELIVVRDPESTVKSIKENKNLSDQQKDNMIQRVQSSVLNAEVDKMQAEAKEKPVEAPKKPVDETSPPSKGKVPLEGEKPSDGLKTSPKAEKVKGDEILTDKPKKEVKGKAIPAEADGLEFSISEEPSKVPKSIIDKPPVEPPKKGEGDPPIPSIVKLSERIKKRDALIKETEVATKRKLGDFLTEHFVDVNEVIKKRILKEGKKDPVAAQRLVNRMNTEAGATGQSKMDLEKASEAVLGKGLNVLSEKQTKFLGEIISLRRTVEIDKMRGTKKEALLKERIAQETEKMQRKLTKKERENLEENVRLEVEKSIEDMKHEGDIPGKEAEELIKQIESKDPNVLKVFGLKDYDAKRMTKSLKAYEKVMGDQLTKQYKEGLISEGLYNKLKGEQPFYSPRMVMKYLNEIDKEGSLSGIKPLAGGSTSEATIDPYTLMGHVITRTNSLVHRNRKLKEASNYASTVKSDIIKNAPFSEKFEKKMEEKKEGDPYLEPEFADTPSDMVDIDYLRDGQRHRVWMDKEMYNYFDYERPGDKIAFALNVASWATLTPVLKMAATGMNPEFAMKNLPIDAMHVWMTTDIYSKWMPQAMNQLRSDYAKVASDAWKKKGRYLEYAEEGGLMDFLTTQGRVPMKYGKYNKTTAAARGVGDAMAKIGEFSEVWTRLAVRERYIDNALKKAKKEGREISPEEMVDVKRDATAAARNYLDFSQGGNVTKLMDKFIPYLNASAQVTRGSLRAAGNNGKLFTTKMLQITGFVGAITAWNIGHNPGGDDEEQKGRRNAYLNDIAPGVKARNFVIMTNMKYEDKAGNQRYVYFKIPKDALQSSISALAEDAYIKGTHDKEYKLMDDKMFKAMNNELRNITDLGNLPPIYRAAAGYSSNYDRFYDTEIWKGSEQPEKDMSQEQYPGITPERYIKWGDMTGLSPVRSQYFAKQLFTESNLYTSMIGELLDGFSTGFSDEAKSVLEKDLYEKIAKAPFMRRVAKSTYPMASGGLEELQREENKMKTANNHKLTRFLAKEKEGIEADSFNEFLETMADEHGMYETERIMDRAVQKYVQDGISSSMIKLKYLSPNVRAKGFYMLLKDNPEEESRLWEEAKELKIASKRFNQEVGRLIDAEQAETE